MAKILKSASTNAVRKNPIRRCASGVVALIIVSQAGHGASSGTRLAAAEAPAASTSALKQLTLGQLMNVEVMSVSRRPEKLLEARFAWRPSDPYEFSVIGQNLLDGRHLEYGVPEPTQAAIERAVFGKVTWRY